MNVNTPIYPLRIRKYSTAKNDLDINLFRRRLSFYSPVSNTVDYRLLYTIDVAFYIPSNIV